MYEPPLRGRRSYPLKNVRVWGSGDCFWHGHWRIRGFRGSAIQTLKNLDRLATNEIQWQANFVDF